MVLEQAEKHDSKRNLGIDFSVADVVNKPSHYQGEFGLEAIDVVRNFAGDLTAVQGFYWGNAMKYMLRFQKKNGLEDLKKARKNLDWLIKEFEDE
ncbi:DUF3310 domain-containing protein [Streptococcus panodentis]|uniref:DUF3310 domain-containing protein n=1 Tax=Streptococcus panodentis TaxID=1581472 RepID=UPI001FD98B9F|nr:DUF3310 domain-containing protein [Streptococcus panodentis]